MSCTNNARVSDSGYTNTCDDSQSQQSGSSTSKNSNRSRSSGYCGGKPSIFCSSNEAFSVPINEEKKDDKKKTGSLVTVGNDAASMTKVGSQQMNSGSYTTLNIDTISPAFEQPADGSTAALVEATRPEEQNGNSSFITPKEESGCQTASTDKINANCNRERFGAVVSLHDGLVLHLTPSFASALGYSKDAWIGQSFIDYIHPKDKVVFANKLTSNVVLPFGKCDKDFSRRQTSLFCSLRRHSDVEINENDDTTAQDFVYPDSKCSSKEIYTSFHLHLSFQRYQETIDEGIIEMMFLVITAQPVISAYKVSAEIIVSSVFSTRHTATGHFSHVDDDVVQYFGYLPQDLLGCWLLSYYHPEDLPYIKVIYETVVRLQGSSFRSKPYRFAVQNGGYVVLETEWSSFINPWEKKLEFVECQHRVIRGPDNPDVFDSPDHQPLELLASMSEETMKESQMIQNEICALLNKKTLKSTSVNLCNIVKNSSDLTTLMKSMIHEVRGESTKMETSKVPMTVAGDTRFPEHDSVVLWGISPHHDYCDSKSSSETPPSYNQLNYNEKLERFFSSKPLLKTVYDNGRDNVTLVAMNNKRDIKSSSNNTHPYRNKQNLVGRGCGSNENSSSSSNNQTSPMSRDDSINGNSNFVMPDNFQSVALTATLLNKHNQEMEKLMVQKHKGRRTDFKKSKSKKNTARTPHGQKKAAYKNRVIHPQVQRRKRRSSFDREGDVIKVSKYDETKKNCSRDKLASMIDNKIIDDESVAEKSKSSINTWPQISVASTLHSSTGNFTQCSTLPRISPMYYIPVPQLHENMNAVAARQNSNRFPAMRLAQSTPDMAFATAPVAVVTVDDTTRARQLDSSAEDSSDSNFYGSFLNTSSGSSCNPDQIVGPKKTETARRAATIAQKVIPNGNGNLAMKHQQKDYSLRNGSPCLHGVNMTPEIIYRYQINPKPLTEILKADRENLKNLHQPMLVNDQLDQLYLDLELDGFGTKLILDDSHQFSDNDDISADASTSNISPEHERIRREMTYSKIAMVYEEDAPLPSSV